MAKIGSSWLRREGCSFHSEGTENIRIILVTLKYSGFGGSRRSACSALERREKPINSEHINEFDGWYASEGVLGMVWGRVMRVPGHPGTPDLISV